MTQDTITTSPAVVKALVDALVAIDKAAPKDMPNMSHYALPAGGIGGDWRAYHHDCAKYQLAQHARQALAFVQLASEEPEVEVDTRKLIPVEAPAIDDSATWHIPPVTVEAETEPAPPLSDFRRTPAEHIQEGDLIVRYAEVWRVKRRTTSKTSPRIHFDVYPVAGGRPERDVYFPREWMFAYKSK